MCLIDAPFFPSKVSSKCPAIMFAVRHTASVPGRIILLIVSMITIYGINMVGVPCGTECSNMWLVFLIHPNNIDLIHRCRAKISVNVDRYKIVLYRCVLTYNEPGLRTFKEKQERIYA